MLDIKFIKENIEKVKYAVKAKKKEELIDIDKLIDVHNNYLAILYSVEEYFPPISTINDLKSDP